MTFRNAPPGNQRRVIGALLALSLLLSGCAMQAASTGTARTHPSLRADLSRNSGERVRKDIEWLADDARQGRDTGSEGYADAADYVADQFAAMGLRPSAALTRWGQRVQFRKVTEVRDRTLFSLQRSGRDPEHFSIDGDFRLFPTTEFPSVQMDNVPLQFVGYGIDAPCADYSSYGKEDLTGKVAVFFRGVPERVTGTCGMFYGSNGEKARAAGRRGAIGAIVLFRPKDYDPENWKSLTAAPGYSAINWLSDTGEANSIAPGLMVLGNLSPDAAASLFEGSALSYRSLSEAAEAGKELESVPLVPSASIRLESTVEEYASDNVVGVLEGTDPILRDEYIVMSAHLDHIGIDRKRLERGEDGIFNGAADNASGVAAMLETARYLSAKARPRRSIIFVALTGEEKGLLGSEYFAKKPPIVKGRIVLDVNLDMPIAQHEFTDVAAVGSSYTNVHEQVVETLNQNGLQYAENPITVVPVLFASDHFSFIREGIPGIYLTPGFANGGEEKFNDLFFQHYHQPSDEASVISRPDQLARFAHIAGDIIAAIANNQATPSWSSSRGQQAIFSTGR